MSGHTVLVTILVYCGIFTGFVYGADTFSSILKQNHAGIVSELFSEINTNCLDTDQNCAAESTQWGICNTNQTEEALIKASTECKKTCNVCPVTTYKGHMTIFAPLNSSFTDDVFSELRNYSIKASSVIRDVTINGEFHLSHVKDGTHATNLNNKRITINVYKGLHTPNVILANGVKVIRQDIMADGSVLHITNGIVQSHGNLVDVMETLHDAHDFLRLLKISGLDAILRNPDGQFTVFVPSNYGFATNGVSLIRAQNSTHVEEIIKYHILPRTYYSAGFPNHSISKTTLISIGHERITINRNQALHNITINGMIQVTTPDVISSNGVIHVIDHVMYPRILPPEIIG